MGSLQNCHRSCREHMGHQWFHQLRRQVLQLGFTPFRHKWLPRVAPLVPAPLLSILPTTSGLVTNSELPYSNFPTLVSFSQVQMVTTAEGLEDPGGIGIDGSGNAWVANDYGGS